MAANRLTKTRIAQWAALALFGVTAVVGLGTAALVTIHPAGAQVLDERFPFLENRQRRNQQQQQYQQWNQSNQAPTADQPQLPPQQQQQQQQRQPLESTRVPPPRRPDAPPSVNVMVFGDSMAEWLAYGLEEAFSENPEIGIARKPRPNTGLIRVEQRGESYDWPQAAREIINAEKPDYVVMMLGTSDRRGIREAIRQPARPPAGQKQAVDPAKPAQSGQPGTDGAAKTPVDAEAPQEQAPQEAAQDAQQPVIAVPEGSVAGTVVREFRSEEWGELYGKRVEEMIGVLKARGIPVFWIGLPPIRGTRATSEMVYLNDIYRSRSEKAGITYVDIWDAFVDEAGGFNNYGPDFEGQTRRLRAADGTNFTRAGARKLAHYVERELRRVMQAKLSPAVATPATAPEPEVEAREAPAPAAPGLPPRPIASPVMSLTSPRGAGDALLGATPVRVPADSVATRVLVRGEAIEAPAGRADDFSWPRRDVITATGVLPPDPVEPPPRVDPAVAGSPAAAPILPKQAAAPRQQRERRADQPQTGWQPWAQQRYEQQQRPNQGLFGGWFGNGRW